LKQLQSHFKTTREKGVETPFPRIPAQLHPCKTHCPLGRGEETEKQDPLPLRKRQRSKSVGWKQWIPQDLGRHFDSAAGITTLFRTTLIIKRAFAKTLCTSQIRSCPGKLLLWYS